MGSRLADAGCGRWLILQPVAVAFWHDGNAAGVEAGGLLGRHTLRDVLESSFGCIVGIWISEIVVAGDCYDEGLVEKTVESILRYVSVRSMFTSEPVCGPRGFA